MKNILSIKYFIFSCAIKITVHFIPFKVKKQSNLRVGGIHFILIKTIRIVRISYNMITITVMISIDFKI